MPKKPSRENRWTDIDGGSAFVIPVSMLRHPNFVRLSPCACKLVLDLARQYSGFNNGYLSAALTILKPMGWRSEATIREAVDECVHYGLIIKTRQGGRNRCNLYAITWRRVDEKQGKPLDVQASMSPGNDWKREVQAYENPSRKKLPPAPGVTYLRTGCIQRKKAPQQVAQQTTPTPAVAVYGKSVVHSLPQRVTY